MGKARPWMLWPYLGCGVCLFAIFAIPTTWGKVAQYAFFLIFYVMLNAGFYTANNIAYSALTALVTRNENERVQLGSLRFVFLLSPPAPSFRLSPSALLPTLAMTLLRGGSWL